MASIDVTDDTFESEVLERSATVPVVVDLWAPWCGPCRTLGPILEKVVDATEGRVSLAKVDVDENPRVGATFRVQSIPAVFAIRDRQVVDHFIGALPEAAVRAFVDGLAPSASPADKLVAVGTEDALRAALDLEPDHVGAITALAELLAAAGTPSSTAEALALLARIPETADTRRVAALARVASAPAPGPSAPAPSPSPVSGPSAAPSSPSSGAGSTNGATAAPVPSADDVERQLDELLDRSSRTTTPASATSTSSSSSVPTTPAPAATAGPSPLASSDSPAA
jgi:putative thioredoxin